MKIGVITHWRSDDNYGQTLQLFALQRILIKMGHAPFLIRYITNNGSFRWKLKKTVSNLPALVRNKLTKGKKGKTISRGAQAFISENINVSEIIYNHKSLRSNPPDADMFIAGSDQVWNKLDGSYFLEFCKKTGVRKSSYAASFGGVEYTGLDAKYVKKWLADFDAVSVREAEGLALCHRLGINKAQLVPDPTFLLTSEEYKAIMCPSINRNKYLLIYLLGSKISIDIDRVYAFAYQKGLEVVYVASQGMTDDRDKTYPNIPQWLSLISAAEYVVTNSFHGTVFSLIFNRQFMSIPLLGSASKMNGRLETLLRRFGLERRLTDNPSVLCDSIFYANFPKQLETYRKEGLDFLSRSIHDKQ